MTNEDILEMLADWREHEQMKDSQVMSLASTAAYIRGNDRIDHGAARQEAQVDAMLRAKYAACGMPDAYQPPDPEDMGSTFINTKIMGDDAIQKMGELLKHATPPEDEGEKKSLISRLLNRHQ